MRKYWRYFRVEGDPLEFAGDNLLTIAIHHGGWFYINDGAEKVYKDGEILYVDGVDPDKMAMTEINSWAYDLGYCSRPIIFWVKIPGSKTGTGYVPINKESHVVRMVGLACTKGTLELYIVCLAKRKSLEELEAEVAPLVNHASYFGHIIDDFPLSVEQVILEKGREEEGADLAGKQGSVEDVGDEEHTRDVVNSKGEDVDVNDENPGDGDGFEFKKRRPRNEIQLEEDDAGSDEDEEVLVDPDYDIADGEDGDDAMFDEFTTRVDDFGEMVMGGDKDDEKEDENSDVLESGSDSEDEEEEEDEIGQHKRRKTKKLKAKWIHFHKKSDMKAPT